MMRKWKCLLSFVLSLAMIMSMLTVPAFAEEGSGAVYKDGVYQGTATAVPDEDEDFDPYGITVEVVIAQGQISSVAYTAENTFGDDNDTWATKAMNGNKTKPGVAAQIISKQSVDGIDAISGATCTSGAIITAVSSALEQAKIPDQSGDDGDDTSEGNEGGNEGDNKDPDDGNEGDNKDPDDGDEGDEKDPDDGDEGDVTEECYALMNVPYAVFYGKLNNGVGVDIVSSATTSKVANCANVYSGGSTVSGGMDLNGVVLPVKMSGETYDAVKDLVSDANADYYIGDVLTEAPAVYMELTYGDGGYAFSEIKGAVTATSGVEGEILSSTTWGDYQVNIDSSLGKDASAVYGVYFTTSDGTQYAMRQSENLWNPHSYCEFAWSTGVKTSDIHGGILHSAHYASMEGKTITSITYITSAGIETYNLASGLYVAPHHSGKISAVATGENTLKVYGVPADLENVTVTVATTGRGSKTLANKVAIGADGSVSLDEGNTFEVDKVYNVVVSSSNFAAMTTTVQYTDDVYALMNVPYDVFYSDLKNDAAVDIVSSATTSKAGACSNVYSGGATVEGGMDLNGVIVPVKMSLDTYREIAGQKTDDKEAYYISGTVSAPAVYMELLDVSGDEYQLSDVKGEISTVDGVEAEILSSTTWGDYQVNLLNNSQGKDASTVYGVYFTTEDGAQYAMRQSENLWNPHNYYEFSWSTGVKTSDIHGGILHSAHYASMEGKTISSITYITSEGIETYNLASGLYVAPHHEGEISAVATSENTLKLYGVPADLENVTVTVATTGRGSKTLANKVAIGADGSVSLDEGNTFEAGKVYNVVVSSSNFAAMTTTVQYTTDVYALMNVPYSDFYGKLNNNVGVDIVSSATTSKVGACSNVYSDGATVEGGMDLNGVVVPVKMSLETYNVVKELVSDETKDYYISQVLSETPAVYVELTYGDGKYAFSTVQGEVTETSDVEAEILSSTTWGDYQVNLLNSSQGKDASTVYGAYFTTEDGAQYAMRQSENLWNPHNYYEFSWSTGVKTSDIHGGILHSAHYASMEGKTISSITYITSEGIETYNLASGLYVAPHHEGEISAVATSENTLKLYGVPADLENVTVTVATTGRGSKTLADKVAIGADGSVSLDEGNTFEAGKVYNVVVSSSNFAAMTTTVQYTDDVYALMNVPYDVFYSDLKNDAAVDIVSSATTSKAGACSNVYSGGATVEGGMDLNGVIVPVKMSLDTYKEIAGLVTDSGKPYYISGAVVDPAVYMELDYTSGKYVLSDIKTKEEATTVDDVEAEILSSTTWGDYQVNLLDRNLGKDASTVYGVYFTTEDGAQYAMRQSENLWNPHSYYEFAWTTGVKTSDIHGGILHSAHYATMEGKTITGITYITSNGIETYNLASGLYVAPHHEGEISAVATSANTLQLSGVPDDLKDVTVTVATTGRGSKTLADKVSIGADGSVTLDEGNTFEADKVYNVVVSSSNFAAMTTTVTYTPSTENPDDNGGDVKDPDDNGGDVKDPDNNGGNVKDPDNNGGDVKNPDNNGSNTNKTSNTSTNSNKTAATTTNSSHVKTGDESHMMVWMAALLLSCAAATTLVLVRRKKQR